MNEVIINGQRYAVFGDTNEIMHGTTFFGSPEEKLQFSALRYDKGKAFDNHIHKYRPRTVERTQECWVVLKGKVKVFVFDENKQKIHEQVIDSGQFVISYKGGHGYEILEDETIVVESKLGDFIGVEADKEKF
jgi:oxalate decarboxylase/phosphoglucose isomerase-like protein (cupin superfamily)